VISGSFHGYWLRPLACREIGDVYPATEIRRYNGAAADYLSWDDVSDPLNQGWEYNDSAGYVNSVCLKVP
jgi:hypothetical protein